MIAYYYAVARREEIFFYKRKEWEYEQEYRVIRRSDDEFANEYFDITDSLACAIICKDRYLELLESMFEGEIYRELRSINKELPVLTYEYDLDGYTLYESFGIPIWSEQCGQM